MLSRVIDVITDYPGPEDVLALFATPEEERRIKGLVDRSKQNGLTYDEKVEVEHYRIAEHIVRMAKAKTFRRLNNLEN